MNKSNNDKIIDWIITKVKTAYKDDIALVLAYGSYINGTYNVLSDLDCYYIPKTKRGYQFATHFIINEIGYDVYPMEWRRVKNITNLKEDFPSLVGDVKILFYSTNKDLKKFNSIQTRLKKKINDNRYVEKINKFKFVFAYDIFACMNLDSCLSDLRVCAGKIIASLGEIVAFYNNDYFHYGLKRQYTELGKFKKAPHNFLDCYLNIIKSKEKNELIINCYNMLNSISTFMGWKLNFNATKDNKIIKKNSMNMDYQFLVGVYEEIVSVFNKVYINCKNGDYILAFLSAVSLQNELDELHKEHGLQKYYILNNYDYENLSLLAVDTKNTENDLVNTITNGGAKIKKYDNFEKFLKEN